MPLTLSKPIVFFDIESTGISTSKDRIIELALLKVNPDQSKEFKKFLLNPGMPIPKEATKVHGITDEDVKTCPLFKVMANDIFSFIRGCDLGGYNIIGFDIPLLAEEFLSCGIDFPEPDTKLIDAFVIFRRKEERSLSAAYKFFLGRELINAHSAEVDIRATFEIFEAQLERYADIGSTNEEISEYCLDNKPIVDYAKKLVYNETGDIVYNFGKHKGKKVTDERDYARWMYKEGDFPLDTKKKLKEIFNQFDKTNQQNSIHSK